MDRQGNHRLRKGRHSEQGRLYLLTTVTRNRAPIFKNLPFARAAIQQLRLSDQEACCRTLAWVLMPDHLHWLIELGHGTLGELMCAFKSRSSCALYRADLIGVISGNLASMTERYGVSRTSGPLLDTSSPTQSVPDWYRVLASILTGIVCGCEYADEGCALISRHKAAPTAVPRRL